MDTKQIPYACVDLAPQQATGMIVPRINDGSDEENKCSNDGKDPSKADHNFDISWRFSDFGNNFYIVVQYHCELYCGILDTMILELMKLFLFLHRIASRAWEKWCKYQERRSDWWRQWIFFLIENSILIFTLRSTNVTRMSIDRIRNKLNLHITEIQFLGTWSMIARATKQ